MIRHVVSWTMNGEDPAARAAQAAESAAELRSLDGLVPSIRSLQVGVNAAYEGQNADLVLIADFDDLAGLEEYIGHPEHVRVATGVRARVAGRSAVDFEL